MTDHISTHASEEDARNEQILIYVDGRIVPKAEAMVSVYDSGFMLGDGVWEGVRLYDGRWAFVEFVDVYQMQHDFAKKVEAEFNKMIDAVAPATESVPEGAL